MDFNKLAEKLRTARSLKDIEVKTDTVVINTETPQFEIPIGIRKALKSGRNIFIHGKAGTGKSSILRAITTKYPNTVVLAPTGIAALNVGGQTLHSFFRFDFGFLEPKDVNACPRKFKVLKTNPILIIDEISMVRSDVFAAIDKSLRMTLMTSKPFGGLQIVLLGDTGQLPPVVTYSEAQFFSKGDEMFFRSPAFEAGKFLPIELKTVYRQSNPRFVSFLSRVRTDRVRERDLEWFNSRVEIVKTRKLDPERECAVLCMTNAEADNVNHSKYEALPGPEFCYEARVSGQFSEKEYPTADVLRLKPGTRVVMLKNNKNGEWVNGTMAVVSRLDKYSVFVTIKQKEHELEPEVWEKYSYEASSTGGVTKSVVGSFKQYPIKMAWALTVHKSQGMTLERMHMDLGSRVFAHGQLYVALSRARKLKGVSISRALDDSDVVVDSKLLWTPED